MELIPRRTVVACLLGASLVAASCDRPESRDQGANRSGDQVEAGGEAPGGNAAPADPGAGPTGPTTPRAGAGAGASGPDADAGRSAASTPAKGAGTGSASAAGGRASPEAAAASVGGSSGEAAPGREAPAGSRGPGTASGSEAAAGSGGPGAASGPGAAIGGGGPGGPGRTGSGPPPAGGGTPPGADAGTAPPGGPGGPGEGSPPPDPAAPRVGTRPDGPDVLRLGGVFPLSGPLGSVGTAMMQGIQAVLAEVNRAGGINGTRLEMLVEDDQFDPVRGKALVQKLITEDHVFAFAGIFSPFTIQAALPDIRAAGVPVFPSGSDDREFDEPLLYPVTNPCGRQMAGNVQHLVQEEGVDKLAVIYLNVEAVANCTDQFTAVARKLAAEVVFESATAPAAPDCASRVLAARASGAEALVVIVDNLGVVKCVQARKQQGWDVPVSISYNIVDDPTLLEALGEGAEGLLSSSPFSGGASAAFDEQCGAIERFYPQAKVQFFMIVGCLGAKLLVEGLRVAGPGASREELRAVLDSGRVFTFGGLVPQLSYRPDRHLPYDLTATVEVRDGRWVRTGPLYTPVMP